jgi:hypothetical protein
MSALDPSYIRSIREGIINGNIEANNQEALPDGLVGLYDKELFSPSLKWKERRETLQFFLVFALAQKEISADFASAILGDEWFNLHNDDESKEEKRLLKVSELIQLHSKRFSSAGGGKYRLYHERFRLYILQKVAISDIKTFNEKFIIFLNNKAVLATTEDKFYKLNYLLTHQSISMLLDVTKRNNVIRSLNNRAFIEKQVSERIPFTQLNNGFRHCVDFANFNDDFELLLHIINACITFYELEEKQIKIDINQSDIDWEILLKHFESRNDIEDKIRIFFLFFCKARNYDDAIFLSICDKVFEYANLEAIDLSEIAPIWLIEQVKIKTLGIKQMEDFFEEVDHDELIPLPELKPLYWYNTEKFDKYPLVYRNAFTKTIQKLYSNSILYTEDFEILFNNIPIDNLMTRDEIVARLTDYCLTDKFKNSNIQNWFFWLLENSVFEIGYHSPDRFYSYELCIRYIIESDINDLDRIAQSINSTKLDYHQKVKILNFISEKYFAYAKEDKASSILTNFIRESKGEIFDDSPWILSWIMQDSETRDAMISRLNRHQKLDAYIDLFIKRNRFSKHDYEEDKLCHELAFFDLVSKAEYLAEFSLKIRSYDKELSIYLINQAWDLISNEKDWAETCAKISVFTVAMEIWNFATINNNFIKIKKTIVRNDSDELSVHLRETILSCNSSRFSSNGCFRNISNNHPNIGAYFKKNFPEEYSDAQIELRFHDMLTNNLNNYNSISDFWKINKKYFLLGKPGCAFDSLWNKITVNTKLFADFTAQDVRFLNTISNKVNIRFPFEKFKHLNKKIEKYQNKYVVPDNYFLGYKEGLSSMAYFKEMLEFDNGFRTVMHAALNGTSKRLKNYNWIKEDIKPIAYATKKCLLFNDDLRKIKSFLLLRKEFNEYK